MYVIYDIWWIDIAHDNVRYMINQYMMYLQVCREPRRIYTRRSSWKVPVSGHTVLFQNSWIWGLGLHGRLSRFQRRGSVLRIRWYFPSGLSNCLPSEIHLQEASRLDPRGQDFDGYLQTPFLLRLFREEGRTGGSLVRWPASYQPSTQKQLDRSRRGKPSSRVRGGRRSCTSRWGSVRWARDNAEQQYFLPYHESWTPAEERHLNRKFRVIRVIKLFI